MPNTTKDHRSIIIVAIVLLAGCGGFSKKSSERAASADESSGSNDPTLAGGDFPTSEDTASEPVEVNGSYLTNLSCMITNQNDTEATDTAVTCKLINERGEKFPGKIESISTKIILSKQSTDVPGITTVLDSSANDSFVAIFAGVAPKDALGITMTASLDGQTVSLQSAFTAGGATTTIADKDLYISATADSANGACTKESPCKSIRRALLFVPDIIAHRVTLHVAAGIYPESIRISGRTIRDGGKFEVVGETTTFDGTPAMAHLTGDFTVNALDPVIIVSGNSGSVRTEAALRFDYLEVESCTSAGILIDNSAVLLGTISIAECKSYPPEKTFPRGTFFIGLQLRNNADVLLKYGSIKIQQFTFPSFVPSPKCDNNPVATNPDCVRLSVKGVGLGYNSNLTSTNSTIEILPRVHEGIVLTDGSKFTVNSASPSTIVIADALRGITSLRHSIFNDYNSDAYPTQEKRLSITMKSVDYGIWVDNGVVNLPFADIRLDLCVKSCLFASNGAKIAIGRDSMSSIPLPRSIVSRLKLNSAGSTPAQDGFIAYAEAASDISILSTVTDLRFCHSSTAIKPALEAGYKSTIRIRSPKSTLAGVTAGGLWGAACTDPNLGDVRVDLGQITVSSEAKKETECMDGTSFSDCVNNEIAH